MLVCVSVGEVSRNALSFELISFFQFVSVSPLRAANKTSQAETVSQFFNQSKVKGKSRKTANEFGWKRT